ncbi:MAG: SDR family NAD(P)-dependent oxidoreductase, partial [Planctomycetes bacterium]|nr:SDR family NAD(P)-dependent oxidoreductase [Planctomycetota bacterium]
MAGEMSGKKVIITGGASGIGLATVRAFAEQGAFVSIWDQSD